MTMAKGGNPYAQFRVGHLYLRRSQDPSNHAVMDTKRGIEWLERAVDGGSGDAALFLALQYCTSGNSRMWGLIIPTFVKAGDLGQPVGYIKAYECYRENGHPVKSCLNLRKAIMCGFKDKTCMADLMKLYKDGLLTKNEYALTLRRYQDAVKSMESGDRLNQLHFHRYKEILPDHARS